MLPNFPANSPKSPPRTADPMGERQELLNSSWFEPCTEPTCKPAIFEPKDPPDEGETGGICKAVAEGVYASAPDSTPDPNRGRNR